jgi:hypothetical protein
MLEGGIKKRKSSLKMKCKLLKVCLQPSKIEVNYIYMVYRISECL